MCIRDRIAFGIMAPAGLAYFIYSEVRERRRYASEQQELAALSSAESESAPSGEPSPAPARARYGHSRNNPWATKPDKERI